MSFSIIITLLIAHWIGDFIFQTTEMALNKNKSLGHLFSHVSVYSLVMFVTVLFYTMVIHTTGQYPIINLLYFWLITFTTHGVVDYFSSKRTHILTESKTFYTKFPNFGFFTVIGLDQLVHYIILFSTYKILFL